MAAIDKCLIDVDELNAELGSANLVIFDASVAPIGGEVKLVNNEYISGASIFDIDDAFSQRGVGLPHTLLEPIEFQTKARKLGVSKSSQIVIYDQVGVYSACRAWWNFKLMGHDNVRVLNGGLPAWKAAGFSLADAPNKQRANGDFSAKTAEGKTVGKESLLENVSDKCFQVADARSSGRFSGRDPEPRKGLRGGHIPGSLNLPFTSCLSEGKLKQAQVLKNVFDQHGVSLSKPIAFTCGSGLTACITLFAAYSLGSRSLKLYDGSWSEWGAEPSLPVATGNDAGGSL